MSSNDGNLHTIALHYSEGGLLHRVDTAGGHVYLTPTLSDSRVIRVCVKYTPQREVRVEALLINTNSGPIDALSFTLDADAEPEALTDPIDSFISVYFPGSLARA